MTKPAPLKIVRQPERQAVIQDDASRKGRIRMLRRQLIAATARYVRDGIEQTQAERLRDASDESGIPRGLIEMEVKKL